MQLYSLEPWACHEMLAQARFKPVREGVEGSGWITHERVDAMVCVDVNSLHQLVQILHRV